MNGKDIDAWAASRMAEMGGRDDPKSQARKKGLETLRKELQKADPNRFPPGSAQHTLALYEQKAAFKHARTLGYEPPEEVAMELGAHALEMGLGL